MGEFIFMLTHDDATVKDAVDVYKTIRSTDLRYVGFKDVGVPEDVLRQVTDLAHEDGREVMLEVVSLSREDEERSVELAMTLGVDWLLGGTHPEAVHAILPAEPIRYCPFVGTVVSHPSVLLGGADVIAAQARELTTHRWVHGVDLLAYRHATEDPLALVEAVVAAIAEPVIVAGSVTSTEQVTAILARGAWAFTIGSAIFEGLLPGGPDPRGQVSSVLELVESHPGPSKGSAIPPVSPGGGR